ncbi:MAG: phosphatase PAP2 family protein [Flavobacteriales bacterium CG_4_9_14_3_um_filter_40_17]|nr:MAG: phosphatase PAP2 family protein [Flavobacteriales bacterium CG_4_9_14_3_um_filter_40_17]
MLESIRHADEQLFLFLNNLGSEPQDGFWLFITNKWSAVPIYFLLAYLILKSFRLKGLIYFLILASLMILATDQTSNLFKFSVERLRPCHSPWLDGMYRLVASRCGGQYGFFSAHAANITALAVLAGKTLAKSYKFVFPLILVWALLVAYSRIYVGVHFPGDVLFGMFVGGFYGFIFFNTWKYIHAKLQE